MFIHVGYPKAASTTLQRHLFAKHSEITGLGLYPVQNMGVDTISNFDDIPYHNDSRIRELYNNLIQLDRIEYSMSDNKMLYCDIMDSYVHDVEGKVVLSHEGLTSVFFSHKDIGAKAARLAELNSEAKIIIVIRNQKSWLQSQYNDHPFDPRSFEIGRPKSFDEWLNIIMWEKRIKLIQSLNYYNVVNYYMNLFGRDNVGVFLFEELVNNVDLFSDKISSFMGIDCSQTKRLLSGEHENVGVSKLYNKYRMLKRITNLEAKLKGGVFSTFDKFLKESGGNGRSRKLYPMSSKNEKYIQQYFASGNAKLSIENNLNLELYDYSVE